MNVAHDVDLRTVMDAPMDVASGVPIVTKHLSNDVIMEASSV